MRTLHCSAYDSQSSSVHSAQLRGRAFSASSAASPVGWRSRKIPSSLIMKKCVAWAVVGAAAGAGEDVEEGRAELVGAVRLGERAVVGGDAHDPGDAGDQDRFLDRRQRRRARSGSGG